MKEATTVTFGFSDTLVGFQINQSVIVARAIEGPFPNYQQVIPKDNDQLVTFNRIEFSDAVKRAVLLTDKETHRLRIEIRRKTAKLVVSTSDVGETVEKVSCVSVGELFTPFVMSFNAKHLLEILTHLPDSEEIKLALSTPVTAAIFTTKDNDLSLLMPLRSL